MIERRVQVESYGEYFRAMVLAKNPNDGQEESQYETQKYLTAEQAQRDAERYLKTGKPSDGSMEKLGPGWWEHH